MSTPHYVIVTCPTCGAGSGERCIARDGRELVGFMHVERVRRGLRESAREDD